MQLNKANSFDTQASLMDFNISLSNGTFSTKIYYKRDNFDFDIVNFPFFDCDVPRRKFYEVLVYIQLIRFAKASSHVIVTSFVVKSSNKPGYRYHKLRKAFSKFYRRHKELMDTIMLA